jgi:hypothetical protein
VEEEVRSIRDLFLSALSVAERRTHQYARCAVFSWGITWVDGDEHVSAHWEDVVSVSRRIRKNSADTPYGETKAGYSCDYRVLLADGRSTEFSGYITLGAAKRSVAAELRPVPGTTTAVNVAELARLLEMGVSRVQLPKAIGSFNAGQAVSFGPLTVSVSIQPIHAW